MNKTLFTCIIFFALCLMPVVSHSAVTLDQSFTNGISVHAGVGQMLPTTPNYVRAQTFEVGLSGTLTKIDVEVNNLVGLPEQNLNGTFQLDVLTTDASGTPTTTSLGTATLQLNTMPYDTELWQSFDLSASNIPVTVGEELAIALSLLTDPMGSGQVWWSGSWSAYPPVYPNGSAYTKDGGSFVILQDLGATDFTFKTYVDTNGSAVPEPTTMLLYGLGFAGAGLYRRMKRRNKKEG